MKYLIKNKSVNKFFADEGLTIDEELAKIYDYNNEQDAKDLERIKPYNNLVSIPVVETIDEASTTTCYDKLTFSTTAMKVGTVTPEHKLEVTSDEVSTSNFSTTGNNRPDWANYPKYVGFEPVNTEIFPHPHYHRWEQTDNGHWVTRITSGTGNVTPEPKPEVNSDEGKFKQTLLSLNSLLDYKNKKYGNAALEPLGIFEGKCKVGQRLDDKLARIKNSEKQLQKNDVADLIGYLTLVCVENGWNNFDEFKD